MRIVRLQFLSAVLLYFGFGEFAPAAEIPRQPLPPKYPAIHPDTPERDRQLEEAAFEKAHHAYRAKSIDWILLLIGEAKKADEVDLIGVAPKVTTELLPDGRRKVLDTTDSRHVGGYPIIAKASLQLPVERELLLRQLVLMVEQRTEVSALCFLPRHAVRLKISGKDYFALICFECSSAHFFDAAEGARHAVELPITRDTEAVFDQLLSAHGTQRSP